MNNENELTARQEEILDHALALVREGGLAAVTTKRLAADVGFSEPALYRHFASKQALILGLMDRLEDLLLGPIQKIASDGDEPLAVRLERIVRHHVRLVLEQNSLPILLLAEASASDDSALLDRMRSIFHRYLALLEGLAREGQTHGSIRPSPQPDCLALLLLGAPAALAIRHRLLPDARAEERFGETLVPFLIRSLQTSDHATDKEGDSP